jgi:4-amino-4-deoxy-L-arabinose transferase-like glycosyltransferase
MAMSMDQPQLQEQAQRAGSQATQQAVRREWLVVTGILLLFLGIGCWYSLTVPPFETPDELFHYAFARHLAQGHGLPVQNPDVEAPWEQEGSQAPLYYWLVGRLTAGIDQRDFPQLSVRNPRANIGDPLFPGNKNFMLYSAVDWPLRGTNLALHVGRWFSLLLGALTLLFTYLTARLLFPASPHLSRLALLIVATIPQFGFISAALTNDNLINTLSAVTVYWLAVGIRDAGYGIQDSGFGIRRGGGATLLYWLILGVLLGLAALSKLQGLGLVLLSGLVVLSQAWQRRDWRLPLRVALPVALPLVLIAGWWYWRNYALYGDWLGVGHLLANNGRREEPLTLAAFWSEFRGLRYSFWGLFGWFNLLLPQWIYVLLDGVTLLALAGLCWRGARAIRHSHPATHKVQLAALLATWALLSFALLIYWTLQATGSQGRLLFPGISALVILLVLGMERWVDLVPGRWRWAAWLALPALLLGASLYTLLVLMPASYDAPAPIAAVPASATPVDLVYGETEQVRLLALEIPDRRYLQSDAPVHADYQLFIQFLDEERREVGNLTSHPGWGRNPTSLWQPGALYADPYPVQIVGPVDDWAPLLAQVYVGFVDPATEERGRLPLPAYTQSGELVEEPFVAQIAIQPASRPQAPALAPVGAQFGQVIELTGYQSAVDTTASTPQTLTVTLQWDAIGTPATDYTAFVQLRTPQGAPVAGFDQAPADERFPTRLWRAGDRILSRFTLTLPADLTAGEYDLWVGLYESASQGTVRLPLTQPGGEQTGDGEVLVGRVLLPSGSKHEPSS